MGVTVVRVSQIEHGDCWTGHIIRGEPTPGQEPELDDLDVTTRADGTALSRSYSASICSSGTP